ncbi:MAG: TIM barrel protein [Planctomycetes bacterium]|nr:TIM barrel protein [Planctomycetota bacterium]
MTPDTRDGLQFGLVLDTVFRDKPLHERMARVADAGLRNIELWLAEKLCPDPADLARQAERAGLRVNSLVMCSPDGSVGGGLTDPARRPLWLARLRDCLDYAGGAGIRAGIVCTGNVVAGADPAATRRSVLEGLKASAELAEAAGVTLLLEALNTEVDHPGYWLTSADEGAALCREVGSPRVRLLFDCYHMRIMGGDVIPQIDRTIDTIGHFHVAGVPGRHEPFTGEMDYRPVFDHLRNCNWRGVAAFEYGPSLDDHGESLRRSIAACTP